MFVLSNISRWTVAQFILSSDMCVCVFVCLFFFSYFGWLNIIQLSDFCPTHGITEEFNIFFLFKIAVIFLLLLRCGVGGLSMKLPSQLLVILVFCHCSVESKHKHSFYRLNKINSFLSLTLWFKQQRKKKKTFFLYITMNFNSCTALALVLSIWNTKLTDFPHTTPRLDESSSSIDFVCIESCLIYNVIRILPTHSKVLMIFSLHCIALIHYIISTIFFFFLMELL